MALALHAPRDSQDTNDEPAGRQANGLVAPSPQRGEGGVRGFGVGEKCSKLPA